MVHCNSCPLKNRRKGKINKALLISHDNAGGYLMLQFVIPDLYHLFI